METISIDPLFSSGLLNFFLAFTDTDEIIAPVNGSSFSLADLQDRPVTVFAVPRAGAPEIGSVRLEAPGIDNQLENVSPYALFGDIDEDFNTGAVLSEGNYPVNVTVYSGSDGSGAVLETLSLNFTVEGAVEPEPTPVNTAPIAQPDSISTSHNTAVNIDVLSNDSDADGDSLSAVILTQGQRGSVAVGSNGTLTYTPNNGSTGIDSFTYQAADGRGGLSEPATVSVDVAAAAPVAPDPAPPAGAVADISGELRQWHKVSITFEGPQATESRNTFANTRLDVTFTNQDTGDVLVIPGFFAADGDAANTSATEGNIWQVNFNPPSTGNWTFEASFRTGNLVAASTDPNAGVAIAGFENIGGSLAIAASNKPADDFRSKGLIIQAQDSHYLQHQGDGDFFIRGGPGVPENFLAFEDFDNTQVSGINHRNTGRHDFAAHAGDAAATDPTWDGGRGANIFGAINYLADRGQNTIYILTNTIGGDGRDVGPWVNPELYDVARNVRSIEQAGNGLSVDDFSTYDVSKLDQWSRVFDHLDNSGIYTNLLLQETENDQLLNGGTNAAGTSLSAERLIYMREMVARFGHVNGLQWNLGEENTNTTRERRDMADFLEAIDPYGHAVVLHTFPSQYDSVYDPLLGDPEFDGPSFQASAQDIRSETLEARDESAIAGDPWILGWDEDSTFNSAIDPGTNNPDSPNERVLRKGLWGHLTANGSGVNWYLRNTSGHGFDQNIDDFTGFESLWTWTEAATHFFNTYIPFWEMTDADSVTTDSNDYVFAKAGEYYVSYQDYGGAQQTTFDLTDQAGKTFDLFWYDPREGGELIDGGTISGGSLVDVGSAPRDANKDWVIFLRDSNLPNRPELAAPDPVQAANEFAGTHILFDDNQTANESAGTYILFDANSDAELARFGNGAAIDIDLVAGRQVTIVAVPNAELGSAESVEFVFGSHSNTESVEPFALFGDLDGSFQGQGTSLAPGSHVLRARFYAADGGQGPLLGEDTIAFTVEDLPN